MNLKPFRKLFHCLTLLEHFNGYLCFKSWCRFSSFCVHFPP